MRGRVAFLSEHASPLALLGSVDAGGQNVYVDEVSRHLAALGWGVDVFTRRDDPDLEEIVEWAPGVRVINLTAGPAAYVLKDELWPFMSAFRDAVLQFAVRDGAKYDVIHSNFWMSGWVAVELKRRLGIPAVHIFHAMGLTKQRHQGSSDTSPDIRVSIEHEVIRGVDRLIAQCPSEQRELTEDYGADASKVALIPSAVNEQIFRPVSKDEARQRVGISPDVPVVVYVGRMLPRKDVRNVVRALAVLARRSHLPVKLLLVGGETEEPDRAVTPEIGVLEDLAAQLGVAGRIHWIGKRQPDVLRYYYSAGDVAVTTPWYEPFGLTPLEAMACGRPVVGSAVGGITFTVQDGVTGYLVPPRAPEALADRLEYVLRHPQLAEHMGTAARECVEREFTWDTVAERTGELYASVLEARAQPVGAGGSWPQLTS